MRGRTAGILTALGAALAAGCVSAPQIDATDIAALDAPPPVPPPAPVPERERRLLILAPADRPPTAADGAPAAPVPSGAVLAHRLLASGRFRIRQAATREEALRLAAAARAGGDDALVMEWGLTDFFVQERELTREADFSPIAFLAGCCLTVGCAAADDDTPLHAVRNVAGQVLGTRIMADPETKVQKTRRGFKARVRIVGHLVSPPDGEIVASGEGLLDAWITGEGWDRGTESRWTVAGGLAHGERSDAVRVTGDNYGRLVAAATDRLADRIAGIQSGPE